MWTNFIKTGLKIDTPNISAAVVAKTRKPQSAQRTSNIIKSKTGEKIWCLIDIHGHGMRLKVM